MQLVQKIVKDTFSVTTLQIIFIFSDLMHIESIFSCLYAGDIGDVSPTPYCQSHLDKLTYVNMFLLSYCQKLLTLLLPITFFSLSRIFLTSLQQEAVNELHTTLLLEV